MLSWVESSLLLKETMWEVLKNLDFHFFLTYQQVLAACVKEAGRRGGHWESRTRGGQLSLWGRERGLGSTD